MADLDALRAEFIARFAAPPRFFRAPGRVNLIGEHTDYNAGFVMPAAIQFYTTVGIAPRSDRRLRVRSTNFAETLEVSLPEIGIDAPMHQSGAHWIDYVVGVARALEQHGVAVPGADLLIHGEVPLGSGLSSSAALELSVALALSTLAGRVMDKVALAKLCQRAENEYVGMRCGIMDQFTSACGQAGHALRIDCRSLEYEAVRLDPGHAEHGPSTQIVICNTMVRHKHAGGEYNRRREECEQGVRALTPYMPDIVALRDVSPTLLDTHKSYLDPLIFQRCRHVVTENARVLQAASALKRADLVEFGRLMSESHVSMRDDYAVSCDELDLMVRLASTIEGVLGARMTGGGFGGCTVNLVRTNAVPKFKSRIQDEYTQATGRRPELYVCEAADGAGPVGL